MVVGTCRGFGALVVCVVFGVGAREHHTYRADDGTLNGRPDWGSYAVDDAAIRRGAGVTEETEDAETAYRRFPHAEPTRYQDDWLPASE